MSDRRDQVLADLADIERQLAAGDLDQSAYENLKAVYDRELADLDLTVEPPDGGSDTGRLPGRSRGRMAAGAAILALAIVAITFAASQSAVDREGGFITGNETSSAQDLDTVTNEQMIEVIRSNEDLPQVNAMRLALAERYFESGEYSDAFTWFDEVLQSEPSDLEASEALGRTAWMVHVSGESEVAITTLARALTLNPNNGEAHLFRGLVYLQTDRPALALPDLEAVASRTDLSADIEELVRQALQQARDAQEGAGAES